MVKLVPINVGSENKLDDGLVIEALETTHASIGGSYAYKLTYDGISIGYSGDTAQGEEGKKVMDWLKDCDFIIFEAGGMPIGGHTTAKELDVILPEHARGRTRIIHYPDNFLKDCDFDLVLPFHSYEVSKEGIEQLPVLESAHPWLDFYGIGHE